jgi:hypothetical protein
MEALIQKRGYVLFTVTWYDSVDDLRFETFLETIRECSRTETPLVVVDGSPSEDVHNALQSASFGSNITTVRRQTAIGKKGAALREAAQIASQLPGVNASTLLCWQEPEKTDMVQRWQRVLAGSREHEHEHEADADLADLVVPYRNVKIFEETYPTEQFHSEMYGNLYLDAVAATELKALHLALPRVDGVLSRALMDEESSNNQTRKLVPRLDWHFGPFAFQAQHIRLWTEYDRGDSYDAQVVPWVFAMRKGLTVISVQVDYQAPLAMKEQEEGNVEFIEKRLQQLNGLDPLVKKAWTDELY